MRRRNFKAASRGSDPHPSAEDSSPPRDPKSSPKSSPQKVCSQGRNPKTKLKPFYIVQSLGNVLVEKLFDFLHSRTGVEGCRLSGIIRVCYASLYLYSIALMTIQMRFLFDPHKGVLPYSLTGEYMDEYNYSAFEFAPDSSLVVYGVFLVGLVSGGALFLGICPRWAAGGCYFFLHNLSNHNHDIFDHEFRMNRMWAFFLLFLPLDHVTVYDGFGGLVPWIRKMLGLPPGIPNSRSLSTSWPMWPFRLWQIYTCMVYMGAGFCKLNTTPWKDGNALSYLWYDETIGRFYPAFVVELLYNRMISIKLQTWTSLVIENLCFITIWPLKTRKITFVAIVLLHIGIELALVMHIFEYLSVLGFVCFFVYPNDGKNPKFETKFKKGGMKTILGSSFRKIIESLAILSLLYLLIYDIYPSVEAEKLMPSSMRYWVSKLVYPPEFVGSYLEVIVPLIGINVGPFHLFAGIPDNRQARLTTVVRFNDGKEAILHMDQEWAKASFVEREIDYWYDAYLYYMTQYQGLYSIPFLATLSVYYAESYGQMGVHREYGDIFIEPGNTVESVSIQLHRRQGSMLPWPYDQGLFASIPREWSYESGCEFVFIPEKVAKDAETVVIPLSSLWEDVYEGWDVASNCINYNPADEDLHQQGQYGKPSRRRRRR